MSKQIGILTAGGDSPGLNAAIRSTARGLDRYGYSVIGFKDGFKGLVENRTIRLKGDNLSGILTQGGTILGTSRDKPHKMLVGSQIRNMTDVIIENYRNNHLDALVCIGGGGTQKNAYRLHKAGLNIVTLPKTIDNDIARTETSFGFDTAMSIATEAIDRLHSTAHSHHRIIVVEIMGHRAGWLALGAGIAGGADVILIPEIPYDINKISNAILARVKGGKNFSIVAVSEGCLPIKESKKMNDARIAKDNAKNKKIKQKAREEIARLEHKYRNYTLQLSTQLEEVTGLESRVTILGHFQRGGTPSAIDRLLGTTLGTVAAETIHKEKFGVMIAAKEDGAELVPLEKVAGFKKLVPMDHPWIQSARMVGTNLGD